MYGNSTTDRFGQQPKTSHRKAGSAFLLMIEMLVLVPAREWTINGFLIGRAAMLASSICQLFKKKVTQASNVGIRRLHTKSETFVDISINLPILLANVTALSRRPPFMFTSRTFTNS